LVLNLFVCKFRTQVLTSGQRCRNDGNSTGTQRKSAHLVTPTPWKIGKIKTIKAVILAYTASFVVLSELDASADHQ
ncbi:hypothetical protein, partial [Salmonella enterica]|uniref:hypothetical protein n=1 Tax=Salmonella enterica TaxID=28901 RepID=UPI00329A6231